MDDNTENNSLKVIATFKELDYKGNVITNKIEKDIPWSLDAESLLHHIIKNGTAKDFEKPFDGYYNDLMKKYFGITAHEEVWRPVCVESETLSCGAKFVFQQHDKSSQVMQWKDVK